MRRFMIATALAAGLGLTACDYDKGEYNEANADYQAEGNYDAATGGAGYNAAGNWPEGARIVEENGVYYRIDPGGVRVRIEEGGPTIVVENGVRYRVDPGGARVRIDEQGAEISVGPDGVDATVNAGDTAVSVNTQ